ncbi:hypothetical protein [Celerinatantimonas sp. MCCC 1A17872]|uniref:hypothetical protein n=1 Tax=Celerinatantimonas sp. MCCC 1A17872 TaxID=3177514 RepID=UPI0038C31E9D
MPLLIPLVMLGSGGVAGFFGGLFAGDTADSLAHALMWLVVIGVLAFFVYQKVIA